MVMSESLLSEVLRDAAKGLTMGGGVAFLERVEALKQRHGGGVSDFAPPRLEFTPAEPFPGQYLTRRLLCGSASVPR